MGVRNHSGRGPQAWVARSRFRRLRSRRRSAFRYVSCDRASLDIAFRLAHPPPFPDRLSVSDTKESERAELHKTIWRIANDLRGSVDGWDFKTYVLGMLFYRFISENLTAYLNDQERKAGHKTFDYAALSDKQAKLGRDETVREKGFYILPSHLFANVRKKARTDANLNETLSKV